MEQKLFPKIGEKYGQWEVITETIKRGSARKTYWEVRCKCGKETFRSAESMIKGRTKSCKSCARTNSLNTFALSYFRRIKARAEKLKLDFDLTPEFLWELYEKQDKKCALSNLDIKFTNGWRTNDLQTCSLDRRNNEQGYTKDNVQWLHKTVNMMKHVQKEEDFITICKLIATKCE